MAVQPIESNNKFCVLNWSHTQNVKYCRDCYFFIHSLFSILKHEQIKGTCLTDCTYLLGEYKIY